VRTTTNTQKVVFFVVGFAVALSAMNVAYTFSNPQEEQQICLQ